VIEGSAPAAERVTDLAYALTTGGMKLDGDKAGTVPVADQVVLRRESRSSGGGVQLGIELSWSDSS
jgi:hypothetical protein